MAGQRSDDRCYLEELTAWAERIRASGAKEVWIYFNNDRDGHAVKNALQLRRMLRSMAG